MNSVTVQLWVVGVCVALALGYTVWGALRNVKRVQAGGAACGGCSGDACGSSGAGCGGGGASSAAGTGANAAQTSAQNDQAGGVRAQPLRWHPPVR